MTGGSGGGRADRVDRRQDQPVQGGGDAEAGHQLDQRGADHGQHRVHVDLLVPEAAVGGPDGILEPLAAQPGRQRRRPRPRSWWAPTTTAPRSASPSNIMPRCRSAACRPMLVKVPEASHGGIAARPSQAAAKAAAVIAWFDRYRGKPKWAPAAGPQVGRHCGRSEADPLASPALASDDAFSTSLATTSLTAPAAP